MNIDDKEIGKLADLARIKLTEKEKKGLSRDIESILGYVSEIQKVSSDAGNARYSPPQMSGICNVMREDEEPHNSGIYTEKILGEAPWRDGNYVRVKKIL